MVRALTVSLFALFILLPLVSSAESIGKYQKGCQTEAVSYAFGGNVKRIFDDRDTAWGQKELIAVIEKVAKKVKEQSLGVLRLGNLSDKDGGNMHPHSVSHQLGLDADISFIVDPKSPVKGAFKSVLDSKKKKVNRKLLTKESLLVMKLFAQEANVERLLVHPLVKKEICERLPKEKWMGKIRPWWKHDDHFHLRISCPKGNTECVPQNPPPDHDDCDSEAYHWWFSQEAEDIRQGRQKKPARKTKKSTPYPLRCQHLYKM